MTKGDFIMKTNFKNEKQIASMIILTALLILSVIMVVNFGKAGTVNTFTFTNSGNTYSAEFEYESVSREGEATNFRITKIEQKDNTSKIVCPTEIKVPDSIIIGSNSCKITSIGGGKGKPFICDDTFNGGNLKSVYNNAETLAVTLPDSVTEVKENAFSNGTSDISASTDITMLTKVTMNGVVKVGNYAFCNNANIETISLNSVETIGNYAFNGCSSISNISLNSVETIGNYAFNGCSKIRNLIMPKTCLTIGDFAFGGSAKNVNLFVLNPNTDFNGTISGFSGKQIVSYKNSVAKDFAGDKFKTFTQYKSEMGSFPSGCDFPASDTSFKAVFSTDGSDLYSDSKVTNTPNLAGDGVYSSYVYLTNEMIAGNSGIKTTVNKAYTTSSDNNSKYTFKGFYIGSKQLFNEKGELSTKNVADFSVKNETTTIYSRFQGKIYSVKFYNCVNVNSNGKNEMTIAGLSKDTHAYSDDDSNEYIATSYEYGKEFSLPVESASSFNRYGYNFKGWYEYENDKTNEVVTKIEKGSSGDRTFAAKWSAKTYKISFNFNGGHKAKDNEAYPTTHKYGTAQIKFNTPVKNGYDFAGWLLASTNTIQNSYTRYQTEDATYTAQWTPHKYTVTFETGTKENIAPTDFDITGNKIDLTSNDFIPTKKGNKFLGWFDVKGTEYKTVQYGVSKNTNYGTLEDVTFYAKWKPNQYNVVCNLDGGYVDNYPMNINGTIDMVHAYGVSEALPLVPEKTGYSFLGWVLIDLDEGTYTKKIPADLDHDATFVAKWSKNDYQISYDLDGGNVDAALTSVYNIDTDTITLPAPTKEGYSFSKWIDLDTNNEIKSIVKGTVGDKKLKALWVANSYKINYAATEENEALTKERIFADDVVLANPTRKGYIFKGWYDNADLTGSAYTSDRLKNLASDVTLYAKWSPAQYKITYDLGLGSTYATMPAYSDTYTVDSPVVLPVPVWTGHTFKSWDLNGTNITTTAGLLGDITVKAIWNEDVFKITYKLNNGTLPDEDYATTHYYGISESLPTPKRSGYDFKGWYMDENFTTATYKTVDATVSEDVTFYARWTLNTYTIYYNLGSAKNNGGTFDKESQTFNVNEDVELNVPTWEGHTFKGWVTEDNEVITKISKGTYKDMKLTAAWNTDSSTISYETNGGTINDDNVNYRHLLGDSEGLPYNVTKPGYVFKGWYDNAELLGDVYTQTKKSESKDMKFYAKWNGAVYSYTFKLDGGTLAKDSNINDEFFDETNNTIKETFGETIKLPKVYKSGCNASSEWKITTAGYEGVTVKEGGKVDYPDDITLEPIWTGGTHKVFFDADGGSFKSGYEDLATENDRYYKSVKYSIDTDLQYYGTLPVVEKDGYTFLGWTTKDKEFVVETDEVKLATDTVLYAQYKKNEKTISYQKDVTVNEDWDVDPNDLDSYTLLDENVALEEPEAKIAWFKTKAVGENYLVIDDAAGRGLYKAMWNYYHDGKNVNKGIKFSINTGDGLGLFNVYTCFTEDHPELSWMRGCGVGMAAGSNGRTYCYMHPSYDYNASEVIRNFNTVENSDRYPNLLKKVKKGKTTADTLDNIARVICANLAYTEDKDKNGNYSSKYRDAAYVINQSEKHECVCVGYAYTFKMMCNYFGIDCVNVGGDAEGGHEWNYVKVGKKYYGVDLTWMDSGSKHQNVYCYLEDAKTFGVKGYDKSNLRKSDLYIEKYITLATTPYKRNVTVDKFKYQITGGGECTLTGTTAKGKKVTNLTINKGVTYNGLTYSISKIGDKAFKNNTYLKKINITAVKKNKTFTVGKNAFEGCKNIRTITLNNSFGKKINFYNKSFRLGNKKKCRVSIISSKKLKKDTVKKLKKAGLKKFTTN